MLLHYVLCISCRCRCEWKLLCISVLPLTVFISFYLFSLRSLPLKLVLRQIQKVGSWVEFQNYNWIIINAKRSNIDIEIQLQSLHRTIPGLPVMIYTCFTICRYSFPLAVAYSMKSKNYIYIIYSLSTQFYIQSKRDSSDCDEHNNFLLVSHFHWIASVLSKK